MRIKTKAEIEMDKALEKIKGHSKPTKKSFKKKVKK